MSFLCFSLSLNLSLRHKCLILSKCWAYSVIVSLSLFSSPFNSPSHMNNIHGQKSTEVVHNKFSYNMVLLHYRSSFAKQVSSLQIWLWIHVPYDSLFAPELHRNSLVKGCPNSILLFQNLVFINGVLGYSQTLFAVISYREMKKIPSLGRSIS